MFIFPCDLITLEENYIVQLDRHYIVKSSKILITVSKIMRLQKCTLNL